MRSAADAGCAARALLAGAARLAGVEGAAGGVGAGGVDRLRPALRLGLAAVRLAAAARLRSRADARGGGGGGGARGDLPRPTFDADDEAKREARDALLPVATHGLGLLRCSWIWSRRNAAVFVSRPAAMDLSRTRCQPLLAAAVGAVLRACVESLNAQTDAAKAGWLGEEGKGWVFGGDVAGEANGEAAAAAAAEGGEGGRRPRSSTNPPRANSRA